MKKILIMEDQIYEKLPLRAQKEKAELQLIGPSILFNKSGNVGDFHL